MERTEREKMTKSPYQRIVRAAARGTGLRLSAEEVQALSHDTAIRHLAANDDAAETANQCMTCLDYGIHAEGWHCARREEPPVGRCEERRGV